MLRDLQVVLDKYASVPSTASIRASISGVIDEHELPSLAAALAPVVH